MFIKYRPQLPFQIEDCYECGKGLHFRAPWRRVYKRGELSTATSFIIKQARNVMEYGPVFSKNALIKIGDHDTVTVPSMGMGSFSLADWDAENTDG